MSSTSATSPSRPSRHARAKSTLTAFQPRPTDDEPLDDLELVRRFDRLTNTRLAKEKSSFHHLYVPDETESRRPGLVDGVLWLAERIFVGPPPKPHKRQHSGAFTSHLIDETPEPEPEPTSEHLDEPDEPELDGEQQLLRTSEEQGWQRCPAPDCGHMIELTEGCMRVKCRCGTMFCYGCGEPWKTCSCPLWDTPVADGGYRPSFDETGEELEDWELVGADAPRVAAVVEQKPSVPEVKIPYYFEEGGITMPGGLFTMVPTRNDTDILYSTREAYTVNTTSLNFPPDDPEPYSQHDDLRFSDSDANSPALEETAGQSPLGEASSSNQRDADLLGFEDGEDPFQTHDGRTPADLPPRYATFDQGAPLGPSFPMPDTSASTSGLGYGHGYGFPTQHDGFEKWDGTPPLDNKKTSPWVEGAGARTNSPPPDPNLLGADAEGEVDGSILGPSIRRTGTPLMALVDPHDQKKMTNIRGSARKRFSMDGTNGRKDLTEKDPPPRPNSAKVLEKEEDQAKMDKIRQNSKKLAGKAKAEEKPKVAAPAPKAAWGKKSPPAASPPASGSPAPKGPWGTKANAPTPASQDPAQSSPAPVAQDVVAEIEKDKDKGTPSGVTSTGADPVKPADADTSKDADPVGEGAGSTEPHVGHAGNSGEEHQEDGGENAAVDVPENSNEGTEDKTEDATTSGTSGNNADPPDIMTSSGDATTGDKAEGDASEPNEGQATSNNAEASDPTNTATSTAGGTAEDATEGTEVPHGGEATGDNAEASNQPDATTSTNSATDAAISAQAAGEDTEPNNSQGRQGDGDAPATQVGDQGEGSNNFGGATSNPTSPNPDNVNTPQTASASSPEIPTAGGGGQGEEDQDGVLTAVPAFNRRRKAGRRNTKKG
ncbi:hypothetical protein PC9H_005584 [Pleurotus ostreatus]|uniref:IBR domain-containing protein n=1 Tax=Pleurotus ostreatus TaxID=5322 RepID=A0A8H7A0X6_PLEOS|nr:uncharacterized protein PC9H_005584 [Pleurotus ostreatus]KAF7433623.1 hypothetical protein PC9H_005584 [Pleurotus ostreatus]KAJ8697628.1 hypothetical protein PTI98_004414 [Pleurotus ostreatus]